MSPDEVVGSRDSCCHSISIHRHGVEGVFKVNADSINSLALSPSILLDELHFSSDAVLSKMAIFPATREGNVHISEEFARVWLQRPSELQRRHA